MLKLVRSHLREFGVRETAERSAVWTLTRLFSSAFRKRDRPSLGDLSVRGSGIHVAATTLLEGCFPEANYGVDLNQLWYEYLQLQAELQIRYRQTSELHPQISAIEDGTAFLIYSLVRLRRPAVAVETGVANGHSSFFILKAMGANGFGQLHSIDIVDDVGGLLNSAERALWRLHVLDGSNLKQSFGTVMSALPIISFFLQDSDHTYRWQSHELTSVWNKLDADAIIVADDVDSSYAFLDFCFCRGLMPEFLLDKRKAFGLVFKGHSVPFGNGYAENPMPVPASHGPIVSGSTNKESPLTVLQRIYHSH